MPLELTSQMLHQVDSILADTVDIRMVGFPFFFFFGFPSVLGAMLGILNYIFSLLPRVRVFVLAHRPSIQLWNLLEVSKASACSFKSISIPIIL